MTWPIGRSPLGLLQHSGLEGLTAGSDEPVPGVGTSVIVQRQGFANGDALIYPFNEDRLQAGTDWLRVDLDGFTLVSGTDFNDVRQDILDGLSGSGQFNTKVRDTTPVTSVIRIFDTILQIKFAAAATYSISSAETLTLTIPSAALTDSDLPLVTDTMTIAARDEAFVPDAFPNHIYRAAGVPSDPDANSDVTAPSVEIQAATFAFSAQERTDFLKGTITDPYGHALVLSGMPAPYDDGAGPAFLNATHAWTQISATRAARGIFNNAGNFNIQINVSAFAWQNTPRDANGLFATWVKG